MEQKSVYFNDGQMMPDKVEYEACQFYDHFFLKPG